MIAAVSGVILSSQSTSPSAGLRRHLPASIVFVASGFKYSGSKGIPPFYRCILPFYHRGSLTQ